MNKSYLLLEPKMKKKLGNKNDKEKKMGKEVPI